MSVHLPGDPALRARLAAPDAILVACLCAQWCGTCRDYEIKFRELAERHPRHVFAWVDIEDHADLLDDTDVEDFPTLLVQSDAGTAFFGVMLPHIGHLDKLLQSLAATPAGHGHAAPDLLGALRTAT